jgi:hypothetical protein
MSSLGPYVEHQHGCRHRPGANAAYNRAEDRYHSFMQRYYSSSDTAIVHRPYTDEDLMDEQLLESHLAQVHRLVSRSTSSERDETLISCSFLEALAMRCHEQTARITVLQSRLANGRDSVFASRGPIASKPPVAGQQKQTQESEPYSPRADQ